MLKIAKMAVLETCRIYILQFFFSSACVCILWIGRDSGHGGRHRVGGGGGQAGHVSKATQVLAGKGLDTGPADTRHH